MHSLEEFSKPAMSIPIRSARTVNGRPQRKISLVVEGGGLRGAFCAGVLAAWDRLAPRPPDFIYATSAGAPSAAYLATGQIDLAIRLWENRTHAHHLVSPLHLFKGRPLMDIDRLVREFQGPHALDLEAFAHSKTKVFIAVTNCRTANADYLKLKPDNALSVLRATMALPVAYGQVITIHGQPYVDGGVVDSIPIERALQHEDADIIVVLTQPLGYRKRRSKVAEAMVRAQYPRYPALAEAFRLRAERYNASLDRLAELEAAGRVSIIRPTAALPASRMTRDRNRIISTIQLGRDALRDWLEGPTVPQSVLQHALHAR
ncbi:MAG TPA: patatin family protein [Polyangiaceae bacterium]|jgi:predicted patatin/cPLA2 family phospholipase|nr:patatin family protein [Polyangiaceae bacterium]